MYKFYKNHKKQGKPEKHLFQQLKHYFQDYLRVQLYTFLQQYYEAIEWV